MVRFVPFAKDGGFFEEKEYRVVISVIDMESSAGNEGVARPIEFRESFGMLIPYTYIFSKKMALPLPLQRIIVGPSPNSNRRLLGIELLLKSLGLAIEVSLSDIPYIG